MTGGKMRGRAAFLQVPGERSANAKSPAQGGALSGVVVDYLRKKSARITGFAPRA